MSGLRIESLRLTEDEVYASPAFKIVADAQLAKALDGIKRWLMDLNSDDIGRADDLFNEALEQANIERPSSQAAAR